MKLSTKGLANRQEWTSKGYSLPEYDREAMIARTRENPVWVHFGAGNIFRAFQANLSQRMLEAGWMDTGLIAIEGYDYEIIEKQYREHDDLSVLVTLKAEGTVEKTVIASVAESCILDSENEKEFGRLKEIFRSGSLQMATFTITEKGYNLYAADGTPFPAVAQDLQNGPEKPVSYIGKVTSLLYERYQNGGAPIAMVSTDNCSGNGDKLLAAVDAYVKAWCENGTAEAGFADYIHDSAKVGFPYSMIDKITPRPDASVEQMLKEDCLEDLEPVVTSKKTYVAPFVNAEESEYLVIEDWFPAGRPALDKVGVIFTSRETVSQVEKMKVTTCLNPLHTALAVFGCLLGYTLIADEMKDPDLLAMVKTIGYQEGMPVVINPGVIDPKEFIDTVVNVRVPNPFMPDTPQRIATDTSAKLGIRYGETIKSYLADEKAGGSLRVTDLKKIPLVLAGWLRYLTAIDEEGRSFELSPDPMIETVKPLVDQFAFGTVIDPADVKVKLESVLRNKKIFGVDLFEAGLADVVAEEFAAMMAGPGCIRAEIKK